MLNSLTENLDIFSAKLFKTYIHLYSVRLCIQYFQPKYLEKRFLYQLAGITEFKFSYSLLVYIFVFYKGIFRSFNQPIRFSNINVTRASPNLESHFHKILQNQALPAHSHAFTFVKKILHAFNHHCFLRYVLL